MLPPEISVLVSEADFDAGKEIAALSAGRSDTVGAVATFIGLVRGEEGGGPADLSVGADETSAKPETTMLQGGRANDALSAVACANTPSSSYSLTLEHYPAMTQAALTNIAIEAAQRWRTQAISVIHRVGELKAGEQIVFVGVASAHRAEAFAACEFIMDYLKTRAPFWKKETSREGTRWLTAADADDAAAARWSTGK